ncbi:23S rRNA (adenine(2503)-C(2))-methyltransferase RlmN [candidate division KSB1 bacterium]|nr:23S rRNA (adenine(2503)-C(2))-methyltransferase RlmN [candidate division KSB1 bacterium]
MEKINLKGLTLEELEQFVLSTEEKKFRAAQLFAWIYRRNALSFDIMTDMSKSLREKLEKMAFIGRIEPGNIQKSALSETQKFLFQLNDGLYVESVLMVEEKRRTVCLSSQVGCALGCTFCATGTLGFKRNLETWEIIDQFLTIQRLTGVDITNIVIMGMGEPFLNYDAVLKACHLFNHPDGTAIGNRRIVISTSGIVPQIYRYTDEKRPFKLAISLNSPFDAQRSSIMPINKHHSLERLIEAARYYAKKSRQRITFEYVLLKNINHRKEDADQLKKLISGIPCKINLIPYNAIPNSDWQPTIEEVEKFYTYFQNFQAVVSIRWSKGQDIQAACGQLAASTGELSV